jgi:hypothetical protein
VLVDTEGRGCGGAPVPKTGGRLMLRFVILLALLASPVPTLADVNCGTGAGARCHCSGTAQCKDLEMSGSCNGPITCGGPSEPCSCVAKAKAATSTIKVKPPVGKSQN